MAITKPYTFQAGTKARASEVNQDFDILYSEVNRIGTEILNIEIDIQNVAEGKADINGNAGQVFKMANAVDSYDGVNKNFLENAIANMKDYISGFVISKNTNTSIRVTSGSCYDSTFTVVINSTGNITKTNTIQGAGTRYVHVVSDNTGRQVDILISSQSTSPALPSGYTRYRLIGNFIADSNSNINTINYYGHNSTTPHGVATIVETYKNGSSWYRIWSDGWCEQGGYFNKTWTANGYQTFTLIKPYKDTNYGVFLQLENSYDVDSGLYRTGSFSVKNKTTNGFEYYAYAGGEGYMWHACGYLN